MKDLRVSPCKTRLDEGNAYWMARISSEVYKSVSETDKTPDEERILNSLREDDPGFRSVTGANKNSAQAALIEHEPYLCMAFRGTDEGVDWLDNLNIVREEALFGEFHRGFWQSVGDVWEVIDARYQELMEADRRLLFLTGHSLGGAMATIAAARLIARDQPFTSVYMFGQPRAMDRKTARIYNSEAKERHFRFVNNEDIVTRVPTRISGFSHVGNCVYIDNDGCIHRDPGFWFKFIDTIVGALESLVKIGDVALVGDHDIENYLQCVRDWDIDSSTRHPPQPTDPVPESPSIPEERSMQLETYLTFDGNCREAFEFYREVFGGEFSSVSTYADGPPELGVPEHEKGRILHISLPIGASVLKGNDSTTAFGPPPPVGGNYSISITPDSREQADVLFAGLSAGGSDVFSMQDQFWGSYFGRFTDKFGIKWMINFDSEEQD